MKNTLSRKAIRTKDPEVRRQYNKTRNQVKKLTRRLRKEFENDISKKAKSNPKLVWQYIKSKSKTREGIGELYVDQCSKKGKKTDKDSDKANILGEFFCSVFVKEPNGDIPTIQERTVKYNMEDLFIKEVDVLKVLRQLKVDKSPGLDSIHPRFLREVCETIAYPLTRLFRHSVKSQTIPDEWKKAKISALFKKGDKCVAGNYRPVSLTSVVCKIMEKLVRNHVMSHMKMNDFFTNKQYGFIAGRSTTLQLLEVMDKWTEALDRGENIDCVYMDYQKAFDTVPHNRLIGKLRAYHISEQMINWIRSFLSGREQQVVVNGVESDWKPVTSGIPQGSVLGPLLFVIFINDLPELANSDIYLFADDTKIFNNIKSRTDSETLQADLDKMSQWSDIWLLKFHPEKCKHMNICRNKTKSHNQYSLGTTTLERIPSEKDIGVYIDDELKFEEHIGEKVKKATQMFAVVRRSFHHLNEKNFIPLYKSLVRTHLEYASSIWSPMSMKLVEQIEGVQRRATKQIPGMKDLSYAERLRKLKLPTLSYRRIRGDMIEIYKIVTGIYDKDACGFLKLWKDMAPRTGTRGHPFKLYPQQARTSLRKNSFALRVVNTWNSLPTFVVISKTVNTFKNRLDKYWSDQELLYNDFKAKITETGSSAVFLEAESDEEVPEGPVSEINLK